MGGSGGAFVSQVGDRLAIVQKLNVDVSGAAVEWSNFAVTPGRRKALRIAPKAPR